MGADRHDGILMSLLVQLTETIVILNFFFEKLGAAKISNIPKGQWKEIFNISETYLMPRSASMMELCCENKRLKRGIYFRKRTSSQMFERVLNTPLHIYSPVLKNILNNESTKFY